MAISVVGTPSTQLADGGSYTAETGSNRAVVFTINCEHPASPVTAVTFGGVSAVNAAGLSIEGTGVDIYSGIWYILEANIPSGTQTIALTGGNNDTITALTLSGVDQTSPVFTTDTDGTTTADKTIDLSLVSAVSDGLAVACGIFRNAGAGVAVNWTGSTTLVAGSDPGTNYGELVAYKATTGATETIQFTNTVNEWNSGTAVSFAPSTGTGAQTIAVGQIVETDVSQAISAITGNVNIPVGQALETDLSQAITVSSSIVVAVAQVLETDLSQAITVIAGTVTIPVAQASETDLAQAISTATAGTVIPVGQILETDLAQVISALTGNVNIAVGQTTETDLAQAISVLTAGTVVAVGQVIETDLSQAIAVLTGQSIAIIQAIETDSSFPISAVFNQTGAVGQAIETDTAQTISVIYGVPTVIGQVLETDLALPFTKFLLVIQVVENDTAQSITAIVSLPPPDLDVIPTTVDVQYNIYLNNTPIIDDMQVYEAVNQVHTAIHKVTDIVGGIDNLVQRFSSIRTITSDGWVDLNDNTILLDGSSQSVTAYIWPANKSTGVEFTLKAVNISNPVYYSPYSGDTIDGSSSPVQLTTLYETVKLKSDGTTWWKV